ncbi:MAG: tyrosine--tRNA ligase [Planctomycetes bacterium]|jgi:tyrosyl-tRNA synthetase|nr:tyrosine--tRNA ligase [Planctomycetota bacterium]
MTTANLYDILTTRGLVAQTTDPDGIRQRLTQPLVAYCGFDPTADSLHVGSLVPIMGLAWLQRFGHKPIVLVGGGTGLIGDPSGKTVSRRMLTREQIDHNARAIGDQIGRVVRFDDSPTGAVLVNNADWLCDLSWVDVLRDYGPHFSVNRMLTMDSVKNRIAAAQEGEGAGLSFLEFNYMVMQAIDFVHLHRAHGCTLQLGGQDQWGNIVMGIELGRRIEEVDLAGLTFPLVTKSDGGKFGKSEAGNIWLDARKTSAYAFYQFWRNTPDADVKRYLGYFTFLPQEEVDRLGALAGQEANQAKEMLAYEVTKLIHGQGEADAARDSAKRAFGAAADVTGDAIPHDLLPAAELEPGLGLLTLLVRANLASSNSEARRLVKGGGVRIGDAKITDIQRSVTRADVTDGYLLLRVGKKKLFRFDVA